MSSSDEFASSLLEEAKRFFEKGGTEESAEGRRAYFHAAIVLAFAAFEAHINAIAEDFVHRKDLTLLDRSILQELEISLDKGKFQVSNKLKIYRLEDRVQFLLSRFKAKPVDERSQWWGELSAALELRNQLTHPKSPPVVNKDRVSCCLVAIIDALDAIYRAVYRRRYPLRRQALTSTMDF